MWGCSIMANAWPIHFKPCDDFLGVHARLDNFQSYLAANRFQLLHHEHDAEAACTDLFQELVTADDRARPFLDRGTISGLPQLSRRRFQKAPGRLGDGGQ